MLCDMWKTCETQILYLSQFILDALFLRGKSKMSKACLTFVKVLPRFVFYEPSSQEYNQLRIQNSF